MAAQLSECELLAPRTGLVVLPCVLDEALVFESIQERVQRPTFEAGEAMQPKERGHAISEIVFGSGGEDPIGADLQDAE